MFMFLEIDRSDIRTRRMSEVSAASAGEGEVTFKLEEFALTSNNVSYALSGDMLDYWGFFPTEAGWGRLPVMGFGTVVDSKNGAIPVGGRYFGFFPVGDFHTIKAEATSSGLLDVGAHREKHAMAYRGFDKVSDTPSADDHAYLLLRGLLFTSFLAEDFLFDNGMFGAVAMMSMARRSKTPESPICSLTPRSYEPVSSSKSSKSGFMSFFQSWVGDLPQALQRYPPKQWRLDQGLNG